MADLQTLERALRNADAAGDVQAAKTLAAEYKRVQGEQYANQAKGMTPQQIEKARVTDDGPLGNYLRSEAMKPMQGETPQQTEQRLYGKPMQDELGAMSKPLSAMAGAADTLTWGAGDEASAAMLSAMGQGDYNTILDKQRQISDTLAARNPKTFVSGQVAGAVAPALLTMGGSTAPSGGQALLPQLGRAAVSGGVQGAFYGFNSGRDGFENRAKSAAVMGATGAALAPAAVLTAKGIGAGWNAIANAFQNRGLDAKATQKVMEMIQRTGMTPDQAAAKLDEMGPDAMLADLAQVDAAGTARANSEAGNIMAQRLADRREAASARVSDTLDNVFGQFEDPYAFRQDIVAQKGAVNPQYRAAIQGNQTLMPSSLAEMNPQLADMVSNMSLGNRQAMAGYVNAIDDALKAGNPQEQASRLLDLRKNFDAQIIWEPREQAMLSPADRANQGVIKTARKIVDDILKKNVDGIAAADAAHAPLSAQQKAFDYGRKEMLGGGVGAITPAENRARLIQMTDPERIAASQGVRATIDQTLANARGNPGLKADRLMARDWNGAKTEELVGKSAAKKLADAIEREQTFTETSNLIEPSRGSRTAVIDSARQQLWGGAGGGKNSLAGDMVAGAVAGSPMGPTGAATGAGGAVLANLKNKLAEAISSANPRTIVRTAQMLTEAGPERDKLVQAMVAASKKTGVSAVSRNAERLARLIVQPSTVYLASPSRNQTAVGR